MRRLVKSKWEMLKISSADQEVKSEGVDRLVKVRRHRKGQEYE